MSRFPVIVALYARYLADEESAKFIAEVSSRYTTPTLERLAEYGPRVVRRASTMALGFLAGYESNAVFARRLSDADRGVRILAENAIGEIWCRDGNPPQQQALRVVMRLNRAGQFDAAIRQASQLIEQAPRFAEAWSQRAVARFCLGRYRDAAGDYHRTLELNPYHFEAAQGMAHCHLELNDYRAALECFRRALTLNPGLEGVRAGIARLKRVLKGK